MTAAATASHTGPHLLSPRQLGALVALTLMWGVNWPMMKLSLQAISPLYFRALTMTLGTLGLIVFYKAKGIALWPRGAQWTQVAALAVPNFLMWHTFAILGVKELASGRAAILGFTMPVWTVILGIVFLGDKLTKRVALAVVCALSAIVLLVWQELSNLAGRPLGIVWMELAAVGWAIGTLMMRRSAIKMPVEAITVGMMAMGSVFLWGLAASLETWPWSTWPSYAPRIWVSLAYGAFINYGIAQVIWFGMARTLPASTSAMSVMAIPLIGTLSATFIIGERPQWQDYAAIVFVMVAIGSVLLPARKGTP
jgi:drug/metabolite transporter (DMT)-like permease